MKLKEIDISNFKCIGEDQKIDFTKYDDNILIVGKNYSQAGMDSNESGKSALLEAIIWGIFGTFPNQVTADRIIRRGQENCSVKLEFDDFSNNFLIHRQRSMKNKGLDLYISGEKFKATNDSEMQEKILEIFGFPKAMKVSKVLREFYNRVFFNPAVLKTFASSEVKSSERLDFIMRFLGLDKTDTVKEIFSNRITENSKQLKEGIVEEDLEDLEKFKKEKKAKLNELNEEKEKIYNELEKYKEIFENVKEKKQLEDRLNNLKKDLQHELQKSKEKRDILRPQYKKLKLEYEEYGDLESEIEKKSNEYDEEKYSKIQREIRQLEIQIKDVYDGILQNTGYTIRDLENGINLLRNRIKQNCPECKTELAVVDNNIILYEEEKLDEEIEEKTDELEHLQEKWSDISQKKDDALESIEKKQEELKEFDDLNYEIEKLKGLSNAKSEIKNKMEEINKQGKKLKKEAEDFEKKQNKAIKRFEEIFNQIEIPEGYEEKADKLKEEYQANKAQIVSIEESLSDIDYRIHRIEEVKKENERINNKIKFDKQAIDLVNAAVKYSIQKFMPLFENSINKWLEVFDAGFTINPELDLTKMRDSFQLWVNDGDDLYLSDERSRGALTRIAIAIGFSFLDIASSDQNIFDFIACDEVVDSLDSTGIEHFFDMLAVDELAGIQKLIISHNTELKNRFDSVLTVIKEDGVSRIE